MAKPPRSRPKLQIAIIFSLLLWLFILLVSSMFPCSKGCPDGFSAKSAGGLKLHQSKCEAFLKRSMAANERRKATATAAAKAKQLKLKGHKKRLGSTVPEVTILR